MYAKCYIFIDAMCIESAFFFPFDLQEVLSAMELAPSISMKLDVVFSDGYHIIGNIFVLGCILRNWTIYCHF